MPGYQKEQILESLVDQFASCLPAKVVADLREELSAGEYGVTFELLCNMLYEFDTSVSTSAYGKITDLGTAMKLSPTRWSFLESLLVGDVSGDR